MAISPYSNLPSEAFWRTGVAEIDTPVPKDIYKKKFNIARTDKIATAGSCFAQHIGRNLIKRGFSVMDAEPAPAGLAKNLHGQFGYSIYSGRYGNIYTVRQMLQLVREVNGDWTPSEYAWIGENGRYYDALRPSVEPDGLSSLDEVILHRKYHLRQIAQMFKTMDIFIFTLGLTEAWVDRKTGTVFPTAPGTIAGSYDPDVYAFKNFEFGEVYNDLVELLSLFQEMREKPLKVLLTVSPVPLTATASGKHVLVSTMYSKAVLRAVAGQISAARSYVDYFPSFEIVSNPWTKQSFYEDNQRSVRAAGVETVMGVFFEQHGAGSAQAAPAPLSPKPSEAAVERERAREAAEEQANIICDEELLEAFGRRVA